jgi:acetyl esterase/lipase
MRREPQAPVGDKLRLMGAALGGVAGALARRLLGRRTRPSWPLAFELAVAGTRATWSIMPTLGMVRWRDASDAVSPLQMDGLTPRFVDLEGDGGPPLHAAWVDPPDAGESVLLYFHGGGFVFGSLRTHGALIGALARAARARTLALEYRLAPEHPSPAALEDALAAYRHLLREGVEPCAIALAGDSAGGTLVLNTLLALRDAGLPLPGAAVAISPWVDLGCSGESFRANAVYDYVHEEHCRLAAEHYLAGKEATSADVSPLFADLAGLPPLLVQAGALETLIDQIRAFAVRAAEAEVPLTFSEYPDMVHVWHLMRAMTPEGGRAIEEAGRFVREHTRGAHGEPVAAAAPS